jgi:pimeloyl-ACP methyl ester carboxylesterase
MFLPVQQLINTDPAAARPPHPDRPDVPIVAVPGLGLSAEVPRRFLDLLRRPSEVVELPGYGGPAAGAAPGPAELARLLLDRLPVDRAVLIGHSASCQIVVEAAVRSPARVAALVLIGPTTDPRARAWPRLLGRWLGTAARERPGQLPRLLHDYHRTGFGSMARVMDAARMHDIRPGLTGVCVPVLVVRGRRDRICPQVWADELAARALCGQVATLSAGAHMVPLTRPAELAATIAGFLGCHLDAQRESGGVS